MELQETHEDCECPFSDWCHEPRQMVQQMKRSKNPNHKVEDCDFYKMIEEWRINNGITYKII